MHELRTYTKAVNNLQNLQMLPAPTQDHFLEATGVPCAQNVMNIGLLKIKQREEHVCELS